MSNKPRPVARDADQGRLLERLRLALDAGQLGVWDWDVTRNRVTWSDRICELHGLREGSTAGRLEDFAGRVHPDDLLKIQRHIVDALRISDSYEVEFRALRADGTVRWLAARANISRGPDGAPTRIIGATYDVTERVELLAAERAARAEAEAARRRLELLATAGETLSRSLDPHATLQAIADTVVPAIADWCRVDLLDQAGVLQRALTYHSDPDKTRAGIALVQRLHASPSTPGSMAWAVATGQSHLARFDQPTAFDAIGDQDLLSFARAIGMRAYFIVPLIARGRTLGALAALQAESGRAFSQDDCALIGVLAQRAALALDNARLYAEAENARRHAESASRAKDEFLAMLGHELRNPLAPIVTALHLMERRKDAVNLEERQIIERQVEHLSRLVDDLLDISRITQGKVQLRRERVDMAAVVRGAVELMQPLIERRKQDLKLDLPPAPAYVWGDALRLTQALSNLLNNAAKFSAIGTRILLQLRVANDTIEVLVEDSGIGIAPTLLPHVFDLFVQGAQAIDRQEGGLGLGLTIVKTLVQLHGGSVSAMSEGSGRGSRFWMELPRASEELAELESAPAPAALRGSGKLLIVDDNADAAETLATMLRLEDYEVRTALDGPGALLTLNSFAPDAAILDIGLPAMDGYELAARLKARLPGLRLIALTGYGREPDREHTNLAAFDEHLVKPVPPQRLIDVLGQLLSAEAS